MPGTINAIVVDDERGCIDNLQHYLSHHCPRIRVIATADSPAQAAELFDTLPVALAFLDVHLFDQNIFEVLPQMRCKEAAIVFVTAYGQYALNAFRASALDYLLKPLETAEILRCYEKIIHYFDGVMLCSDGQTEETTLSAGSRRITLRQGDSVYIIHPDSIVLLKAQGFYTAVCFEYEGTQKTLIICKPISLLCKQWNFPDLLRVHRSYVINLKKVTAIKKHGTCLSLEMGSVVLIPVAKRKAADFFDHYHV